VHIIHVGDARVYRLRDHGLEQLTEDHRVVIAQDKSYLSRALGIHAQLDIDYRAESMAMSDVFLLATDGVYEYIDVGIINAALLRHADDLDAAAQAITAAAFERGSPDNLTAQLIRIDALPARETTLIHQQLAELPLPPLLESRAEFDGYEIVREIHGSSRSHIYLAIDKDTGDKVVIKTPSVELSTDAGHLEAFLMEEWIARRIDNLHVMKPGRATRQRHYLYVVTEYIEGQTLAQWRRDHPQPDLETVRNLLDQIAKGVQAFHRLDMLHQDLRPENILIDQIGTVKLIDFGSARVAGVAEAMPPAERSTMLGTLQYAAPEYFLWEEGTTRSDQFSLGVIVYQLLCGRLPYGVEVAKCKTAAEHKKLKYASLLATRDDIPLWVDGAIKKAVHPNPDRRYEEISEFLYDLRHPNKAFQTKNAPPIIERNPLAFWKGVSLLLFVLLLLSLISR
jgi:serine/threonine protein kinase